MWKPAAFAAIWAAILVSGLCSASGSAMAADTYRLEPTHSSATIYYAHFGLSRPSIKIIGATGSVVLDTDTPANSTVEASLPMAALTSGLPKFDDDLKGPHYFDVVQYPAATFRSTKVELTGETTANVTGDLSVHGITKSIVLAVTFNRKTFNPALFKTGVGFSATAHLKRSDFGLTNLEPILGDDIDLDIEAEAYP